MPEAPRPGPLPPDCWRRIFGNDQPVVVEIGPGRGEFLLDSARRNPGHNFFAIEHSPARTREIVQKLAQHEADNARAICGDAGCLIESFPPASVAAFHVQFPDPWWKRRHQRRRLWTPRFVAALCRALVAGGTVELITDVGEYFALAQRYLTEEPGLEVVTIGHTTAVQTSFARKAVRRGWVIHRSLHRRRA